MDADARTVRILQVSLRMAGYSVTTAANGLEALAQIESSMPDLVISDTSLPVADGFTLVRRLKERPAWATIPVLLFTRRKAVEDRIRAVELGVDDCLTKPVFVREVVARVRLLLDHRLLEHLASGSIATTAGRRVGGMIRDIGVADLLQTFEMARQDDVVHLRTREEQGAIYLREGQPVDARLGALRGEEAVYRALATQEGTFEIELSAVANTDVVARSTEALVLEGMRRASAEPVDEAAASRRPEDVAMAVPGRSGANVETEVLDEIARPVSVIDESPTVDKALDQWLEGQDTATTEEQPLENERIPGVPRRLRPATKGVVAAVLAAAAMILVAAGLRGLRARQERLAEASRTPAMDRVVATAKAIDVPPPPPSDSARASAQGAERDSAIPSPTPIDSTTPESNANQTASSAPTGSGVPEVARWRAAVTGVTTSTRAAAAPPAGETPIEPGTESGGGSLVARASRALAVGANAKAVDLARQAIAANPVDADAWMTLAAAYQASGNVGAARSAYASCVAQAKTPSVSDCRLLAAQGSP